MVHNESAKNILENKISDYQFTYKKIILCSTFLVVILFEEQAVNHALHPYT